MYTLYQNVHQWTVFSVPTPLQLAVAKSINTAFEPFTPPDKGINNVVFPNYYAYLKTEYQRKRSIYVSIMNFKFILFYEKKKNLTNFSKKEYVFTIYSFERFN